MRRQPPSHPVPDVRGAPVAAALVTDHPAVLAGTGGVGRVSRPLPAELVAAVGQLADTVAVPVATVYLAAFGVLLRKYGCGDEPVVGGTRVTVDPAASFAAVLRGVTTVPAAASGALVLSVDAATVHLDHDDALFGTDTVARIAEHYERVLCALTDRPYAPVGAVGLVDVAERARIIGEFNATARPYPYAATVHGLFRERAARAPWRTAVVCGPRHLTYGELDALSDRLARRLVAAGVRVGRPVGVLLPRGPGQVVAFLAVLKAGGAYLPIDDGYPARRVGYLLADSGATVVVAATAAVRAAGVTVVVDDPAAVVAAPLPGDTALGGSDLAYIVYPSGATGRPRGVEVTHRGVVRLVSDPGYVTLTEDTRILATCAPVSDVATFELWGALLGGGSLHLVPDDTIRDATALGRELRERRITTLWLTSSLFDRLVGQDPAVFATLRELLVGGEALSSRHAAAVLDACPGVAVLTGYGPAENTTFSTTHRLLAADLDRVPIGRPVPNSTAYVLDPDGLLCPVGVPGELCLGGDGVARGYLGRPVPTAAVFVPDPFAAGPEPGRLHRSGDVARWRADGVLEFFGRRDHQVRGVRSDRAAPLSPGSGYVAPRDHVERTVALLAERALGVAGIGVRDDLRDLGADSLTAARIAAGTEAELGVRIGTRNVLREATVERISALLRAAPAWSSGRATTARLAGLAGGPRRVPTAPELPDYPLSPQQRRVHVEQLEDETAVHHNVPLTADLPAGTDPERLCAALARLTERHEALRTGIVFVDGEARQRIHPTVELPVSTVDGALPVRPFDLARAPLWRAAIASGRRGVRLSMDLHQLVTDGLSLAVLLDDLAALYHGAEPPPVTVRYRDYAHWAATTPPPAAHAAHWRRVFAAPRPATDLPLDLPRGPLRGTAAGQVRFELDSGRTAALRGLARDNGTTLFAVLAAAYQALLAGLCGEPDITVGVPVAGRTAPGVDRTVGLFVNTVCLRSTASPGLGFAEFLGHVAEATDDALANQDHPLEAPAPPVRDHGRAPLFDALIALHSERYLRVDFGGTPMPLQPEWNGRTPFDLNLQVYETDGRLRASWRYASDLFRHDTVLGWRDALLELLDSVIADPRTPLGSLVRPVALPLALPELSLDL